MPEGRDPRRMILDDSPSHCHFLGRTGNFRGEPIYDPIVSQPYGFRNILEKETYIVFKLLKKML
jgi:hypothetical protein